MSVASRPVSTGKTRTCPHCKATILESLSICPGCMHHLRFDSEAAKRQVAAAPALRVEGVIRHPPLEQPLEYFVIIAVRNDRGEEVTRQVVNVGALQAAEKRTFTLSVEVLPPQAPPAPQKSTSATGTFKAATPQPATAKPASTGTGTTSTNPTLSGASSLATPGSGAASAATGPTTPAGSAAATKPAGAETATKPAGSAGATNPAGSAAAGAGTGRPGAPQAPRPGQGGAAAGAQTPRPGQGGSAGASGSSGASGSAGAGGANPQSPASGSTNNPAGQGTPGDKPKPTSGYILKPPSPGGPKRH